MLRSTETRLGDLVAEQPRAARVLDALGLDYCCGGERTLAAACTAAGLSTGEVLERLEATFAAGAQPVPRDFRVVPLSQLVDHIVQQHHVFTREELARIPPLADKVLRVHGERHPELRAIRDTFAALAAELLTHLAKEEQVLFPYVLALEAAAAERRAAPVPPFRTVANPVRMMRVEHESAGGALRALREASRGYAPPADGCGSYRALYGALEALEQDLHQHIHLENNILFPRAVALEDALGRGLQMD